MYEDQGATGSSHKYNVVQKGFSTIGELCMYIRVCISEYAPPPPCTCKYIEYGTRDCERYDTDSETKPRNVKDESKAKSFGLVRYCAGQFISLYEQ